MLTSAAAAAANEVRIGIAKPVLSWDTCFAYICPSRTSTELLLGYGGPLGNRDSRFFWEIDGHTSVRAGRIADLDGWHSYRISGLGAYAGWRTQSLFFFSARAGIGYTHIAGPAGHDISGSRFTPVFGIGVGVHDWTVLEYRRIDEGINSIGTSYRFHWP